MPPKLTAPTVAPAGSAASPTRSTRSRSLGPRCVSRGSTAATWRGALRELKLLVDHRDDLVDERRRASSGCAGTCTSSIRNLSPRGRARPGGLARPVGRWLPATTEVQVQVARELVARCRSLTRTIVELDRELRARSAQTAPALLALPGCGALTAAKLLGEIGPIERFQQTPNSPATAASHHSKRARQTPPSPARPRRQPTTQLRPAPNRDHPSTHPPPARAYLARKQAEGKSRREALRCLKRQLARTVYTTLENEPLLT